MSTKWQNHQRLQKTPKVCKKPPLVLPLLLATFERYPLQAYATWTDPSSILFGNVTGYCTLKAEPSSHLHWGEIKGHIYDLELDLLLDPATGIFTYTIQLMCGSNIEDVRFTHFTDPTPAIPFQTNMFVWHDPPNPAIVQSKIYS